MQVGPTLEEGFALVFMLISNYHKLNINKE